MDRNREMSRALRMGFMVVAVFVLVGGLLLFAFAESVATLPANTRAGNVWPWPIGPLALRFVAALLLAAAVSAYLVARRPDPPTVAAFASVLVILDAMLLLHFFVNWGSIDWSKPVGIVWLAGLAVGLAGGVLLLVGARRQAVLSVPPLPESPMVARNIAIFIAGLTVLVGGTMFFAPEFGRERWPWDLANTTNVQLLGAVFFAVGLSALVSWLQPSWYGYDIFYPAAATFATVALIASFMHWNLFAARPISSWVFVVVYILGAVMGFYPYFRYGLRPENRIAVEAL